MLTPNPASARVCQAYAILHLRTPGAWLPLQLTQLPSGYNCAFRIQDTYFAGGNKRRDGTSGVRLVWEQRSQHGERHVATLQVVKNFEF
jgi:hypothetical protein